MKIPWYVAALGAAVVWGVHYPLVDFALKRVSLMAVLLLTAVPILAAAVFSHRTLAHDYAAWGGLAWGERVPILALMLTSLLGAVLLYLSISGKNATLASLIEISYPLFVALFAYLLFRQIQLTLPVLFGGALVLSGVAIIIRYNP
jgi:drug/metabolite transporter (DMT)-like permease